MAKQNRWRGMGAVGVLALLMGRGRRRRRQTINGARFAQGKAL